MFTGLIETVGVVEDLSAPISGALRLRLRTGLTGVLAGESVAVNGVCLTATLLEGDVVHMDVGPETIRVTTLGGLRPGMGVNLERAMRAGDRFGGHFVQGHVDSAGVVEEIRGEAEAHWLTVRFPPELAPGFIHRGAVAVDGISLTVASLGAQRFDVMVVPFTWTHTNLSTIGVGDRVNLECDMVGKYVVRAVRLADEEIAAPTVAD
jgi:riboflavin synthase